MECLTVSYRGVEFDVQGEYIPCYDDEGGYIDGLEISIDGQDITEFLDDRVVDAIEEEAIKNWKH